MFYAATLQTPKTYHDAHEWATTRRKRRLGHATRLDDSKAPQEYSIVHHDTPIVTFYQKETDKDDVVIRFSCSGYYSKTTRERLNEILNRHGFRLYQENRIWYVCSIDGDGTQESYLWTEPFILRNGKVKNPSFNYKAKKRMRNTIKTYIEGYTSAFMDGKITPPPDGDCFACLAGSTSTDHLVMHFAEKYYVGSLLVNAVKANEGYIADYVKNLVLGKLYLAGKENENARKTLALHRGLIEERTKKLLGRYLYPIFGFAGA